MLQTRGNASLLTIFIAVVVSFWSRGAAIISVCDLYGMYGTIRLASPVNHHIIFIALASSPRTSIGAEYFAVSAAALFRGVRRTYPLINTSSPSGGGIPITCIGIAGYGSALRTAVAAFL